MASTVYEREISDACTAGYLFNVQADLPCSDISSAIDRVVIHGRDKSIVELMKTLFRYNLFFVTSSTQPNGASDTGIKTRHREFIMSRFSHDFHDMKYKKGKGNKLRLSIETTDVLACNVSCLLLSLSEIGPRKICAGVKTNRNCP